ncbi:MULTISPECIES: acyltransferase family protein [unclassified Pseudomonas]|uniref:acyltransferase family protein n=1 Tax=unclassified Pseudomonas TaxID=196821 RepID=UPI0020968C2F|nr:MULTISPECIES: acyltransferase family protein [unclassified Pseudomonas]MCO7518800.1 acyltransferase [Pseudomonas sp. 1]MCO7540765.1 acyltransferase [Pseudomonas sp. VA159-2]
MESKAVGFRSDINGLRAWAVASVVLYHFDVAGFSGGFVGVDLFFVISGYLMVGIIARGLSGEKFSIIEFYLARAKRILPALVVLCFGVLVLGWYVLLPSELKELGVYVIAALGFFSNVKLKQSAGYFTPEAHDNLLLHTWSLSVEWQFYMVLPVVMFSIWKLRPKCNALVIAVVLGLIASFCLSITLTSGKPEAAFYLLHTRAWELLVGGLIFFYADRFVLSEIFRRWIEAIGFSLIVFSILIFDSGSQWPGWRAAVPVFGAALVILAARQGSWWTGGTATQWLGSCSYSIYLWHWPIAVLLAFWGLKGHLMATLYGLCSTLVLGTLSYRYVEKAVRNGFSKRSGVVSYALLLCAALIVGASGVLSVINRGFPGRLDPPTLEVINQANNRNPRLSECAAGASKMGPKDHPVPDCRYGNEGKVKAVVIGDSHSSSIVTAVKSAMSEGDVLQWSANACPLAYGIRNEVPKHDCGLFLEWSLRQVSKLPKNVPVVLVNRFSVYFDGPNEDDPALMGLVSKFSINGFAFGTSQYREQMRAGIVKTVCELAAVREVYIVRPTPEQGNNVPVTMGRSMMLNSPARTLMSSASYNSRNFDALQAIDQAVEQCGAKVLDPIPYLCSAGECWGDMGGLPIYFDDDHLNERGSQLLVPMFQATLNRDS